MVPTALDEATGARGSIHAAHCEAKWSGSGLSGYQAPCAKYFSKFISAYKAHGISMWGVTVQNEAEAADVVHPPLVALIRVLPDEHALFRDAMLDALSRRRPHL